MDLVLSGPVNKDHDQKNYLHSVAHQHQPVQLIDENNQEYKQVGCVHSDVMKIQRYQDLIGKEEFRFSKLTFSSLRFHSPGGHHLIGLPQGSWCESSWQM